MTDYKDVVPTVSAPVTFRCATCVRAGVALPPVLAVVGEGHRDPGSGRADFDAEILGGAPTVLIRSERRNKREAKIDNSNLIPLALPLDPHGPYALPNIPDTGFSETARFLATRRLLPRAAVEVEPIRWEDAPIARTTIFRAPFDALTEDSLRVTIQCPRGHRVQVTRGQLVRLAAQAMASGDESPTI